MITARALNRTLLQRQHLLERVAMEPMAMVEHLVGLQAQDPLPPYLSLFARLREFDPLTISAALEARTAVRVTAMRGTIHLLTAADALALRIWVQPLVTRAINSAEWGRGFPAAQHRALADAATDALADGPLGVKQLGEAISAEFEGLSATAAGNLAKSLLPLAQLPPRGMWQRTGGVVYDLLERMLEAPAEAPDPADVVRRYLRAFGPASPADFTTWSGVTGAKAIFDSLGDELVRLSDDTGKPLWDIAGLPVATGDEPAPVRLLGVYDNAWLSHAKRDRLTRAEQRTAWQSPNGGFAMTVFVDGMLEGLWWRQDSGTVDVELFRTLSKPERADLDEEVGRVESFLRG